MRGFRGPETPKSLKEYTLNHIRGPILIYGIFLN